MARKPVGATRTAPLAEKIARLVRERGWTIQQFALAAKLNRHTARKILEERPKWLRADTLKACALALACSVDELIHLTAETLLERLKEPAAGADLARVRALQPALADWLEAHPKHGLSKIEVDELASVQGVGGQLTEEGVEVFVEKIERKRRLLRHVEILAGTAYLPLLEQLTEMMLAQLDPLKRK